MAGGFGDWPDEASDSVDGAVAAWIMLGAGLMGLAMVASVAIAHFVFGVQVRNRSGGAPFSALDLILLLLPFALIGASLAVRGRALIRQSRAGGITGEKGD